MDEATWKQLKAKYTQYPLQPFPWGPSRCHWCARKLVEPLRQVFAKLPTGSTYLELGSFLGAGTTRLAMESPASLRAVCVDHWRITAEIANQSPPRGRLTRDKKAVDFLQGKGTALEHFLNNTFAWQARVVPVAESITTELLFRLAEEGVQPQLILVDDDHKEKAVFARLVNCTRLWPHATLLLDDCVPRWNGVRLAYKRAVDQCLIDPHDCRMIMGRVMHVKRSSRNAQSLSAVSPATSG